MTNIPEQSNGKYYLPVEFRSKFSVTNHFLFLFGVLFFGVLPLLILDSLPLLLIIFSIAVTIMVLFIWFFTGILRLGKIEIDNQGIYSRQLFMKAYVKWEDVKYVGNFEAQKRSAATIEITAYENVSVITSPVFKKITQLSGRSNTLTIPLDHFPDINQYVLIRTINGILENYSSPEDEYDEEI